MVNVNSHYPVSTKGPAIIIPPSNCPLPENTFCCNLNLPPATSAPAEDDSPLLQVVVKAATSEPPEAEVDEDDDDDEEEEDDEDDEDDNTDKNKDDNAEKDKEPVSSTPEPSTRPPTTSTLERASSTDPTTNVTKISETPPRLSLKEMASLTHQYGMSFPKKRKASFILKTYQIPYALNKAARLRIACKRRLYLWQVNQNTLPLLGGKDKMWRKTSPVTETWVTPMPAVISFGKNLKKKVKYNRTTKMRFLYTHLPSPLRRRFGMFEEIVVSSPKAPVEKTGKSKHTGIIDGNQYEIEEIRYDYKRGRPDVKTNPPENNTQKTSRKLSILVKKREREMKLKQRRENRLLYVQKLPFSIHSYKSFKFDRVRNQENRIELSEE